MRTLLVSGTAGTTAPCASSLPPWRATIRVRIRSSSVANSTTWRGSPDRLATAIRYSHVPAGACGSIFNPRTTPAGSAGPHAKSVLVITATTTVEPLASHLLDQGAQEAGHPRRLRV